jgi:ketosteroid isomerase-like protein
MKHVFRVTLIALCCWPLLSACGQRQDSSPSHPPAASSVAIDENVPEMLSKLEKDWADATMKGDIAFQDRIMADDYLGIMEDGTTNTKQQCIDFIRSGQFKAQSITVDDIKVRVFGDTAVATYHQYETSLFKGKDYSGQTLWTDVFLRRNGKWQIAAEHGSRFNETRN